MSDTLSAEPISLPPSSSKPPAAAVTAAPNSLINGVQIANDICAEVKQSISQCLQMNTSYTYLPPKLVVIIVGDRKDSLTYVGRKVKTCGEVGIRSEVISLGVSVTESELLKLVEGLNKNSDVTGILVQLPLPDHINEGRVIEYLDPTKDVDGLHPYNVGRLTNSKRSLKRPNMKSSSSSSPILTNNETLLTIGNNKNNNNNNSITTTTTNIKEGSTTTTLTTTTTTNSSSNRSASGSSNSAVPMAYGIEGSTLSTANPTPSPPLPSPVLNENVGRELEAKKRWIQCIGDILGDVDDSYSCNPCTAEGVVEMCLRSGIALSGSHVVVLGRSSLVGLPVALLFQKQDATVTMCHSKTKDIQKVCQTADVLVVAIGKPGYVKGDWVKKGAAVLDVGINAVDDANTKRGYKLCGDVLFEEAKEKASKITPVPGGVGPVTVAVLVRNTIKSQVAAMIRDVRRLEMVVGQQAT